MRGGGVEDEEGRGQIRVSFGPGPGTYAVMLPLSQEPAMLARRLGERLPDALVSHGVVTVWVEFLGGSADRDGLFAVLTEVRRAYPQRELAVVWPAGEDGMLDGGRRGPEQLAQVLRMSWSSRKARE